MNKSWAPIIARARQIAETYDTPVTLRQLFYRLVSEQSIPNNRSSFQTLSRKTARLRETGEFPHFIDQNRKIDQPITFDDPADAIAKLARFYYRRDRTEGQEVSLYLGVEKRGIVEQLRAWFGDLGIPIIAFGGYQSVTLTHDIELAVKEADRPAILIYAGDFDPSGENIQAVFAKRSAGFNIEMVQIALKEEQISKYNLPINAGKPSDPRSAAFLKKYGRLIQVELDALPPEVLRQLYTDAIERYWDDEIYKSILDEEHEERLRLIRLAGSMVSDDQA